MIDADAVDRARAQPVEDPRVAREQDVGILVTDADERRDVEESAIGELARGDAPMREAVVLMLEQRIELDRICVDRGDLRGDGLLAARIAGAQRSNTREQDVLVAMPAPASRVIA